MSETPAMLIEREGLDVSNVTNWEGRPKRTIRPAPASYWEEYVETDTWYVRKLTEDVPEDELFAACYDEDLDDDEGEDDEDDEISSDGGEEDNDYVPDETGVTDDELSEASEEEDDARDDASSDDTCEL